jgi:hypothetical protein
MEYKMYGKINVFLCAGVSFALSSSVQAQMNFYTVPNLMVQNMAVNQVIANTVDRMTVASKKKTVGKTKSSSALNQSSTSVRTEFAWSPVRSKQNLSQFVEKTRQTSPELANELQNAFASRDIFNDIKKVISPYGLKTNDIADAMTVYWVLAYGAVNEIAAPPAQQDVRSVRQQVVEIISNAPSLGKTTDVQKQQMSEALLIQGLLASSAASQARKQGPEMMGRVADAVNTGAKASFGFDLRNYELTSDGFIKK